MQADSSLFQSLQVSAEAEGNCTVPYFAAQGLCVLIGDTAHSPKASIKAARVVANVCVSCGKLREADNRWVAKRCTSASGTAPAASVVSVTCHDLSLTQLDRCQMDARD